MDSGLESLPVALLKLAAAGQALAARRDVGRGVGGRGIGRDLTQVRRITLIPGKGRGRYGRRSSCIRRTALADLEVRDFVRYYLVGNQPRAEGGLGPGTVVGAGDRPCLRGAARRQASSGAWLPLPGGNLESRIAGHWHARDQYRERGSELATRS